jgi:hypothetical protein
MSSVPPPSSPPPGPGPDAAPADRRREIVLDLDAPRKGLRGRLGAGKPGFVRLHGAQITVLHPVAMTQALTLAGGYVTLAAVDRGAADAATDHGRFAILRRLGPTQVVPREHGIEGWLWTTRQGSGLPSLLEDEVPNLALLFTKPLDEHVVAEHFRPEWVRALAERSPLGTPAIPGLLLAVASAWAAEEAFRQFGVLNPLTDRDVPPAMRRHLPTDKPANPTVSGGEDRRAQTSIAPPGLR